MLIQNTLFGIVNKENIAIERIKLFEPKKGYYLAFSGGKDSCVIKHLTARSGVKFNSYFNLTTVDPPELLKFIRENHPDVEWLRPPITMYRLIVKKLMPPTQSARYCCEYLKEYSGDNETLLTGLRWQESYKRSKRKMVENCYRNPTKKYVNPIIDWTSDDVWEYIKKYSLKYCSLYDEGFSRIGCLFCPLSQRKGMLRDAKRWPKVRAAYVLAFEKMIKNRTQQGKKTTWETGEDVYSWWVRNIKKDKSGMDSLFINVYE